MKEEWEKPELIVIIKTEIEEDVLSACKLTGVCMEAQGPRPGNS